MLIIVCSCGISVIPHIATLIISRFLLGLGCGFSMIVGGIYIRQTYSERKRRSLGGVYSLFKMIGSEISLGISYFLSSNSVINIHLYITLGVGLLAVIQMVLTKFVLPEIALEMLMVKNKDELNVVLNCLYH
jgi:MFS family permease